MKSLFKFPTNTWVKSKSTGMEFEITFIIHTQYYKTGTRYSGYNGEWKVLNVPEHDLEAIDHE